MLTDHDFTMFATYLLNKGIEVSRTKDKLRDLKVVLEDNFEKLDMPVALKTKYRFCTKIIDKLIENKSVEYIMNDIKYSPLMDDSLRAFFKYCYEVDVNDDLLTNIEDTITSKKKNTFLKTNIPNLEKSISYLKDGFISNDDNYDELIKFCQDVVATDRKIQSYGTDMTDSIMYLGREDLKPVINSIKEKLRREKKTPTGYLKLDHEILEGGLEPEALYVIGGGTGSGKSTMMLNWMINAAKYQGYTGPLKDKLKVFIYISLENRPSQTIMRMYCKMFNCTKLEMLGRLGEDEDRWEKEFNAELSKYNSLMIPIYKKPQSIGPVDVDSIIRSIGDDLKDENFVIGGVYVDYLNKLRCDDRNISEHRLQLGSITDDLKAIAVNLKIPIVTATQLGRGSYRINNSFELNTDQIAESIRIAENTDFLGLLAQHAGVEQDIVHFKVSKNRDGISPVYFDCKIDFKKFQFKSFEDAKEYKKKSKSEKVEEEDKSKRDISTMTFDDSLIPNTKPIIEGANTNKTCNGANGPKTEFGGITI